MTRTALEEGAQSLATCEFSEFRWDGSSHLIGICGPLDPAETGQSTLDMQERNLDSLVLYLTKGSRSRRWRSTQQIRDHLWTTLRTSGDAITLWPSMTSTFCSPFPGPPPSEAAELQGGEARMDITACVWADEGPRMELWIQMTSYPLVRCCTVARPYSLAMDIACLA